jgi:hypothetical protein
MYRHSLFDQAPETGHQVDDLVRRLGQTWAVPAVQQYTDDDLLTAELAADEMHVATRTIYAWRQLGLTSTATPDGPRYRVADLRKFVADRRRKRT